MSPSLKKDHERVSNNTFALFHPSDCEIYHKWGVMSIASQKIFGDKKPRTCVVRGAYMTNAETNLS
jgi:hypothetical protein